jgi:hypothetical protein
LGGLSKKAFQFEKLIDQEKIPALILDSGSLLFKNTELSIKQTEQEQVTAFGIVKSYNRIGYNAVGIAREDLIAGLDFLKKISEASDFPWISANLVDTNTKSPIFQPNVLISKGSITVGVTALTAADLFVGFKEEDHATILPWREALPGVVEELRQKADLIILLSNLPVKDNRTITELYPEIDIILQAGVNSGNQPPQLFNDTLICQTGKQGKQIGIMKINWQNTPWGTDKEGQLDKNKKSLDRINWQLSKYEKYKDPLVVLQDNPARLAIYKDLVFRQKKLEEEINKLSVQIARSTPDKTPSTYTNRFMAMETSLPDHKDVTAIVDQLNEELNRIGKKQISRNENGTSPYIGSENCAVCHEYQSTSWKKSRHARAYETLANSNQQFNLDCLPCHVTGSGDLDMGDAVNLSKSFQAVGCENCHGPGRRHAQMPAAVSLPAQIPAATCLKCHTDDRDDNFDFAEDVRKLNCLPI